MNGYDDHWIISNVNKFDLPGDADRYAYSEGFDALYEAYVKGADRRASKRGLCLHLVKLRKKRFIQKPAGLEHLPYAKRMSGWKFPLNQKQEAELIRLYCVQPCNKEELAYTPQFEAMYEKMIELIDGGAFTFCRHELWLCLDYLRKSGKLPRRGRDRRNVGRRSIGIPVSPRPGKGKQ